jgi:hypothetical protein
LELERLRLQQIQAQKDLQAAGGGLQGTGGMPGWAIATLAIGGVAVVGTIIYFAVKK